MIFEKVYIDGYKNLIDTSITFKTSDIPLAIIGNNGTGKSNLIEALLHIFLGVYFNNPPSFNFQIEYEAHNKNVIIKKQKTQKNFTFYVDGNLWSNLNFRKRIREVETMPPFPALVFCYYSGTCDRTKKLIQRYNRHYQLNLRNQSTNLERLFVFSDIDQAEMCLLGLFAHRYKNLLDRLSLCGIEECRITLMPPQTYSIDKDEPFSWGTKGAIRDFLADIDNSARESYKSYSGDEYDKSSNHRTYIFNKENLEKLGGKLESRGTNLFSMLQVLGTNMMLADIDYKVIHASSDARYRIDDLSEGEKQLLCVIGGIKLSQQNECLVLLDEPDTHLNPVWSWEFDSLLKDSLVETQQKSSTVIVATHDPVLISGLNKEQVLIARLINGRLSYERPIRNPRGQGVANVLTSEYFGLPSSLDKNTQDLLDERLSLAFKPEKLTQEEKERLSIINERLEELGLSISFRDPDYKEFEEERNR